MSSQHYIRLLKKADNDLKIAKSELLIPDPVLDLVCFHIQQYVEKSLKANLIYKNLNPSKTHNIGYLIQKAQKLNSGFSDFINGIILGLSDCAVEIRYDQLEFVEKDYVEEAMREAIRLWNFIDSLIK